MNPPLTLHHCAKRIAPQSLEFVMELFAQLNCKESYHKPGARWAMAQQNGNGMILQFIGTAQKPQKMDVKKNSHIAFLSKNPEEDIAKIKKWVEGKGKSFASGAWSDREFYFDCPDVFVDFVVEIMNESVTKG